MIILATPACVAVLPASVAAERRAALPASSLFVTPLAAAAEQDLINLVGIAEPRTPWPRQMRHTIAPTLCLIGDDPTGLDGLGGPDAWRCACKLGAWAQAVIVHGAGGEASHYEMAVQATFLMRRVVLIETTSLHAPAWAARIDCPRTLMILPNGGPHPLQHRGTVH